MPKINKDISPSSDPQKSTAKDRSPESMTTTPTPSSNSYSTAGSCHGKHSKRSRPIFFFAASIAALASSGVTLASDPGNGISFNSALRDADLVFVGKVASRAYVQSQRGQGDVVSLPHTFVTYQIEQVLKGSPRQPKDKITLRFRGGLAPGVRGFRAMFMQRADAPLFDVGDRDVLFVSRNGRASTPIVGVHYGRFRIIDDKVFTERGVEVLLTERNNLAYGKVVDLPEVMTHIVTPELTLTSRKGPSPPEDPEGSASPAGKQFTSTQFIEFVSAKVASLFPAESLAKLPIVPSADPKAVFTVRQPRPVAPRISGPLPYRPSSAATSEDRAELRALEANGGNPVLRRPTNRPSSTRPNSTANQ